MLIVEDDPLSARLLFFLLADAGCNVRVAGSAEAALAILTLFPARAIVLDLVLPRMSGLLLARTLKTERSTCDIVIVAVSVLSGPDTERVALAAGCVAYVCKPIDTQTFAWTLACHLKGRL